MKFKARIYRPRLDTDSMFYLGKLEVQFLNGDQWIEHPKTSNPTEDNGRLLRFDMIINALGDIMILKQR